MDLGVQDKELVVPSKWEQIDEWIISHDPVDCPPPFPADVSTFEISEAELAYGEAAPGKKRESSIRLNIACPAKWL